VDALIDVVLELASSGSAPPPGTVLAEESALCESCPRADSRTGRKLAVVRRPHEVRADPELCFQEQGILCLGFATRGGCGATCIAANMPCRGCFGPLPGMLDPAAEALGTIGSLAGLEHEDGVPPPRRLAPARSIRDLGGTFYRFTLPVASIPGRIADRPRSGEDQDV
jgi:F420-non-reducing hydrogenase small subunit